MTFPNLLCHNEMKQRRGEAVTPADLGQEHRPGREVGAELGLLAMIVIWGVNFSVIKVALSEVHPLAFNGFRFPLAALVLWLTLRRRGPITWPDRKDWARIAGLGVLGNVVYQLFFIYGVNATTAGNASILLATTPIWTVLLSNLSGHEPLRPLAWVGVLGTLLGIVFIVVGSEQSVGGGPGAPLGDLCMVAASAAWSIYTVGSKRLVQRYGSLPVTAWTLWIGALGLIVVGGIPMLSTPVLEVSLGAWGAIAYAGMLGIGVAYSLWYHGVRRLGNTRTAVHGNLVPVVAIVVAWLWLGEIPAAFQIVGAGIIIGGVSLTRLVGRVKPAG